MTDQRTSTNTLQGVEKAFTVVTALQELDGAGVSELADYLEIPPSTAQVHLNTLHQAGYVLKDDGTYRLSLKFLKHGSYARRQLGLYRAAKRHIDELAEETGEAANLGVAQRGKRVLVYKSESPAKAVYDNAPTGEQTHLHWTALGKALLSVMPDERVDAIVDEHGLPRANEHTITDREALHEELHRTRERGYSVEDQDRRKGILAVGVPIVDDATGNVVGAVCVSGPRTRLWDDGVADDIVEAVQNAANVIELRYNHYISGGR
ncbi:IclR family transcriptional regulator [Halomicroarcula sp. GCM10025817]|uniref:IclR family transcriptional regulator n=1 Tax=Halomicroarcula sp. GCM10025817 TaxID=3252672 RepID=UPI00361CBD1B